MAHRLGGCRSIQGRSAAGKLDAVEVVVQLDLPLEQLAQVVRLLGGSQLRLHAPLHLLECFFSQAQRHLNEVGLALRACGWWTLGNVLDQLVEMGPEATAAGCTESGGRVVPCATAR